MKITYLLMAFSILLSVTGNALAAEKKDIVDTAVAAGNFKTLAAATGLVLLPVVSRLTSTWSVPQPLRKVG